MKNIILISSLFVISFSVFAQINTREMANDICKILTKETTVKKDIDGFQITLKNATSSVMNDYTDAINNYFLLNPKLNNSKSAYKWGQEMGMELSNHLMCNCTIYQEVILNKGDELPIYSPITEQIGNQIEAKIKAKSKKNVLPLEKCKKIMYEEISQNKTKIVSEYGDGAENFIRELQLYLFTQTTYFSRSAINKMHSKK